MDIDKSVNKFLHKYSARAKISDREYYQRYRPNSYKIWEEYDYYGPHTASYQVDREPMVEMYVPQDAFRKLVEREEEIEDLIRGREWEHNIVQNLREEEKIRDANPAVRLAWEKYAMMLELVRK
jgi:hypothetical protein